MATSLDQPNRWNDLPVGRKLMAAFAIVVAVQLVQVSGLWSTVSKLESADRQFSAVAGATVDAASATSYEAAQLRAAQQAYVLDGGASRAGYEAIARQFEASLHNLEQLAVDPAEQALTVKIATGYQTFTALDQMIIQALQSGEAAKAKNLALGPEALNFGFMAADAANVTGIARAKQDQAAQAFAATASRARWAGGALGLIAILLVVVLTRVVTKAIRDPLARVQDAAERAASGQLDTSIGITSADETGRLAAAFDSMLKNLRDREQTMLVDHRRQELDGKIYRALDMADEEDHVIAVVGHALDAVLPGRPAELLLADSSKAHLSSAVVAGPDSIGPGCSVESPFACTAVRSGHTMTFESSTALDACPKLVDRPIGNCSAVCVPVTFMGRAIGVLHAVGADRKLPTDDEVRSLEMLSTQSGARIGMLRSIAKTHTQATTDGMTGMLNRRAFETRLRSIHRGNVPFAVVMADLDHFKQVNDTFGHEAGDRALRVFAEVLKHAARTDDLVARFGGEEFVLALPNTTPDQARDIADRLRVVLAGRLATGDCPVFTASFGIADSHAADELSDILKAADRALYRAKSEGRDRATIDDGTPTFAQWETDAPPSAQGSPQLLRGFPALVEDDDPAGP